MHLFFIHYSRIFVKKKRKINDFFYALNIVLFLYILHNTYRDIIYFRDSKNSFLDGLPKMALGGGENRQDSRPL